MCLCNTSIQYNNHNKTCLDDSKKLYRWVYCDKVNLTAWVQPSIPDLFRIRHTRKLFRVHALHQCHNSWFFESINKFGKFTALMMCFLKVIKLLVNHVNHATNFNNAGKHTTDEILHTLLAIHMYTVVCKKNMGKKKYVEPILMYTKVQGQATSS